LYLKGRAPFWLNGYALSLPENTTKDGSYLKKGLKPLDQSPEPVSGKKSKRETYSFAFSFACST
jgi:hypothetical protein